MCCRKAGTIMLRTSADVVLEGRHDDVEDGTRRCAIISFSNFLYDVVPSPEVAHRGTLLSYAIPAPSFNMLACLRFRDIVQSFQGRVHSPLQQHRVVAASGSET